VVVDKQNGAARSAQDFTEFKDGAFSYSRKGPTRSSADPQAPLGNILQTLYSEHRYILSLLAYLEEHASRLQTGKVPDYHLLMDIIDYLTHYPDQYHHPREDLLFSQILDSDSQFQKKLDRLEREHQTLHHYTHELFNTLTGIVAGRPVNRPELLQRIGRYIEGYRQHMEYENREVFTQASGEISPAQLRELGKQTRFINDPLFGGEVQYQYRRLGRSLQAQVEIVGQNFLARELSGIESGIEQLSNLVGRLDTAKTSVNNMNRENWREQLETVKAHTGFNNGPNIVFLPAALTSNYLRHLQAGFGEIREILSGKKSVS
jgi:hemerythrin-like domain-containing protein